MDLVETTLKVVQDRVKCYLNLLINYKSNFFYGARIFVNKV
jgi:hypothetical protein